MVLYKKEHGESIMSKLLESFQAAIEPTKAMDIQEFQERAAKIQGLHVG